MDNRGKLDEARYQTVLVYIVICSLFIGVGTAVIQASSVLRLPIINSQDDIYYFDDDDGEGGSNRHFGRYIGPYQLKEKHLASPLSDDGDDDFLKHYNFLNGSDSKGSNGYVFYVDRDTAFKVRHSTTVQQYNVVQNFLSHAVQRLYLTPLSPHLLTSSPTTGRHNKI